MLAIGEKVFITQRRNFEGDLRRHFVGEVMDASDVAIRVQGYDFAFDDSTKFFERRDEIRIRIYSIIDATGLVISLLPIETNLAEVRFTGDGETRFITDKKTFKYVVAEFGFRR